ncbi:uncharacterized protein TOT_020000714 [Theileria orientalis strain Shintoku]|uniref:Histone-binding protein RBBP4-like N-terminal domain-containing protein n=1 Tax=Theileria orientalis strain Shintoku TaxID=869250 RepID=J4C8A7_THEOR|nr:uncharacterized protein TOT_020000714 [Theileria orientalis strain Shintoku]PVC52158.1 hypothetical protein MACL_00001009 [Theileria orientalis]BAM40458.1 uncharacterized protein TOT_020000714 [Theileria orientalis strain Shintoku]|eukprot:XP_009690759.1 uncharacterized protein TOT_020000714 [Theileria orientalis strain Shintoku]
MVSEMVSDSSDDDPSISKVDEDGSENGLIEDSSDDSSIEEDSEESKPDAADIEDESSSDLKTEVWRNDLRPLESDEHLELSPGCYDMLHRITLDWSCLSFDILKDDLGACRVNFPMECYVVSGTQPGTKREMDAQIHVMRWSNLTKNFGEINEDLEEDEEDCIFKTSSIKHKGIVNRIRACPQSSRLVCSLSANGSVYIWDIQNQLNQVKSGTIYANVTLETSKHDDSKETHKSTPLYTGKLHSNEGYGVGWSSLTTGLLATGDCDGTLVCYEPVEGGWKDSQLQHFGTSVEDIRWSYTDANVLLAACCDGKVKLVDVRDRKVASEITVTNADVNAISINPVDNNLVLAGSEDGTAKIYDLRFPEAHMSNLKWHNKAITSVDWHPLDSSVCAVSSRDDSVSIWDVSIESETNVNEGDLPQQMLFLHMDQQEITELMFHRNIPGVIITTALDGFNIFKTVNVD